MAILIALLIGCVLYMLVKARLRNADPVYLSGRTRDAREAAMILYRASKMNTDQTRFISLEQ